VVRDGRSLLRFRREITQRENRSQVTPDLLEVKTITRAAWSRGDTREKIWDATYYLRPVGDGYKIVHWRYRWPFSSWGKEPAKRPSGT
jgi:hypothetical protein